ncbi:FtsW/RodA/SpoVE family cell cycle protein [bacterium]|nr:MAG: FtsW/RodA/SpoVE family cell cycle protein [bacterium]
MLNNNVSKSNISYWGSKELGNKYKASEVKKVKNNLSPDKRNIKAKQTYHQNAQSKTQNDKRKCKENVEVRELIKKGVLVSIDKGLLFGFIGLIVFGVLFVFDASAVVSSRAPYYNQFAVLFRHLLFLGIGSFLTLLISRFRSEVLSKFSLLLLGLSLLGLFLTLVPSIGVVVNGARRWISIGGFTIQFSEIVKPILILYLAFWLPKVEKEIKNNDFIEYTKSFLLKKFLPFCILITITLVPIVFQKDLGSIIVIGFIALVLFVFSANSKLNFFSSFLILTLGAISVVAMISFESYRVGRFEVYTEVLTTGRLSKELALSSGYQIQQVLIAIGSGGISGLGLGESKQKYAYLVDQTSYTDTIFAVIAEELGFVGSLALVLFILFIVLKGINFSNEHKLLQHRLLVIGIISWFGFQSFINIAANVSLIPFKGLTLPFISYGGSSLLALMIGLGILFSQKYE